MYTLYYIGLDIHKRVIAYCIKALDGRLIGQGKIDADRKSVGAWLQKLPGPWIGAMEATIFTGWIYDFLKPHAVDLKVAHPEMLKAITAAKKKNDRKVMSHGVRLAFLLFSDILFPWHANPAFTILAPSTTSSFAGMPAIPYSLMIGTGIAST